MIYVKNILRRLEAHNSFALAILAIIILLFFLPIILTPDKLIWSYSHLGSDIENRHWGDFTRYAEYLRQWRIPLWDSSVALGHPLPGDLDVVFGYPLIILFAFLPTTFAFNLYDALHVFIAGASMFYLLRLSYQLDLPSSLFGAFAFAFMPKFIAHLAVGHVGLMPALSWVPLLWLGFQRGMEGSYRWAAVAGAVMAMQVPLHIQIPYYAAAIASVFWLWQMIPSLWFRQWFKVKQLIIMYVIFLIAFVLIGASTLIPLIETLPYNSRIDLSLADANSYALLPTLLLNLLAPPLSFRLHEWTVFIGVMPPLLSVIGILNSPNKLKWLLLVIAIYALIFALGSATPVFDISFYLIPGFRLFREPSRLWFFGGLALIVLASLGVASLRHQQLPYMWRYHRKRWAQFVGIYVFGGIAGMVGYYLIFQQFHYFILLQCILMIVLGVLGWLWLSELLDVVVLQWALVILLLFDLLPFAKSFINLADPNISVVRSTPALDYVSAQKGIFRTFSVLGDEPYAMASVRGIEMLDGLLGFQIEHTVKSVAQATGCNRTGYVTSIPACLDDKIPNAIPNAELLGRLNVRYVLTPQALNDPQFKLVQDGKMLVYENLLWLSRSRLATKGSVEITKYEAGSYEIALNVSEPTQLIVSETWLPGWKATSDGRELMVTKVEGALIGVAVSPSDRVIRLVYDPLGWQIGWRVSLISLIVLCGWILFSLARPKRKP